MPDDGTTDEEDGFNRRSALAHSARWSSATPTCANTRNQQTMKPRDNAPDASRRASGCVLWLGNGWCEGVINPNFGLAQIALLAGDLNRSRFGDVGVDEIDADVCLVLVLEIKLVRARNHGQKFCAGLDLDRARSGFHFDDGRIMNTIQLHLVTPLVHRENNRFQNKLCVGLAFLGGNVAVMVGVHQRRDNVCDFHSGSQVNFQIHAVRRDVNARGLEIFIQPMRFDRQRKRDHCREPNQKAKFVHNFSNLLP